MKDFRVVMVFIFTISLALVGAATKSNAEGRDFYLMVAGGIATLPGETGDFVDDGGGLVAGVGGNLTENVALEGEFIGGWASVCCGVAGRAEFYSGMLGPRFSIPLDSNGKVGIYAGGGIGVVHTRAWASGFGVTVSGYETRFGWQAKSGIQFAVSDAVDLFIEVRYGAQAKYSDDGVLGGNVGFRFYPDT